jgi:hypothetical protein
MDNHGGHLQVALAAGERWIYHPPKGQTVAWLAVGSGCLEVSGIGLRREVPIFPIGDGNSEAALERGEAGIWALKARSRAIASTPRPGA